MWYSRSGDYFIAHGFTRRESDNNLYVKTEDGEIIVIILYVDDLIIIGNDTCKIKTLKK